MNATPAGLDLEHFGNSPYARELRSGFGRLRFAADVEPQFLASNLQRFRLRIRVWHSTVLALLIFDALRVLLPTPAEDGAILPEPASISTPGLLLLFMLVNVSSRAGLVFLAWGPWFPRAYPLLGTLLISLCHGLWAFLCSREVLGAHPEFLAALVTDAFAAYFFCGLQFRQALAVNAFAAMGLVLGSFYHANQLTPVLPYAVILLTNMVMAAIAGFGQERSARNSFIEHSLLGELAARDGLTGLKNRRSLDEHLERVWKQAIRDRRRLALLMVDVDHFKRYNDLYGHQAGDRALKCVASVVETFAKRPLDIAARYGGEELVVVLYDTAQTHVTEIAERVVHAVHALRIEHEGSNEGVVTVSIGAALIPPTPQRSSQGALQLADQALYEAKRAGRNKVIVLEQEYDSLATGIFRSIAAAG